MTKATVKPALASALVGLVLSLALLAFTPMRGLDSYEIFLNDKLIMKQFVNQPLNLRMLQLEKAAVQDELSIRYTHCTFKGPGSDRTIVLKDEEGHLLKEWDFANSSSSSMKIKVGELLQLEEAHKKHKVSLSYNSKEMQKPELLAFLRIE